MTLHRVISLLSLLVTAAIVSAQGTATVTVRATSMTGAAPVGPAVIPVPSGTLPDSVRLRLGSNLFRDPNYISATALSPEGKVLAVCGGSQIVRFLDLQTGQDVRRIQ